MKPDKQIAGNMGLYYTCYQLSRMGWNVMPTARNARGIDVIAYNRDGTEFIGVQIKSLSKRDHLAVGSTAAGTPLQLMGDWWVIVNNLIKEPTAYIMRPAEVMERVIERKNQKRYSYWLDLKNYDDPAFREQWSRIGYGQLPEDSATAGLRAGRRSQAVGRDALGQLHSHTDGDHGRCRRPKESPQLALRAPCSAVGRQLLYCPARQADHCADTPVWGRGACLGPFARQATMAS